MHRIARRRRGWIYTVLVPNLRGAERALSCQVDEVDLVMSVSEKPQPQQPAHVARGGRSPQLRDVIKAVQQTAGGDQRVAVDRARLPDGGRHPGAAGARMDANASPTSASMA